jgi:galactokinase
MPEASRLALGIENGEYDSIFSSLYRPDKEAVSDARERYVRAIGAFEESYGSGREVSVYSVPGRVELCGNHTDHNRGVVLASAVNLDIIAVVSRSDGGVIRVRSRGFGDGYAVDLSRLEPIDCEVGRSSSMIRGVAAGIMERGGTAGGFDSYMDSDVIEGSGLSSSASFEVCIGAILNGEYNSGRFGPVELALIGQSAENKFFGKPCGLMDQVACAVGGAVSIDLEDQSAPVVTRVPFDLSSFGLSLVVTDTGGDHAGLTSEYAAIRSEMESVACLFGRSCLREVGRDEFFRRIAEARDSAGDRAVLRAIHFFEECRRVGGLMTAIENGDRDEFLRLVIESGRSSFEYNQNAYCGGSPERQGVSVGLALSQIVLNGRGAWRLQGGGFAGTIQGFVPDDLLDRYRSVMSGVFGPGASRVLGIRDAGLIEITARRERGASL